MGDVISYPHRDAPQARPLLPDTLTKRQAEAMAAQLNEAWRQKERDAWRAGYEQGVQDGRRRRPALSWRNRRLSVRAWLSFLAVVALTALAVGLGLGAQIGGRP